MFSKCPPAIVPHLLKVLVGTVEQGHVLRHPLPCLAVGNGLHDGFILHRVEVVNVVLVVVVVEESGSARRRTNGHSTNIGNGESRCGGFVASIVEGAIPIGRGVNIRESAL